VAVVHALVRVEGIPALAAALLRSRVPGDRQRLEAAAIELDQVLLKRIDAKRVSQLIFAQRAVRALRGDEEAAVAPGEGRGDAAVAEHRAAEVAEHGFGRRALHRAAVVRGAPRARLLGMTPLARGAAGVRCRTRRTRLAGGPEPRPGQRRDH